MNLEEYMKQEGITIAELSEQVGVSESTLKRIFKGYGTRQANTIKKIAQALDISVEKLKALLNAPPSSDYVGKLVNDSLNKLSDLGLSFKPKRATPDTPIYKLIEQDLCGEFSYFLDQFEDLVKQAGKQEQLNALKELALYCTAFLVVRETEIDLKNCSQINLSGGNNAWELRIFINANIDSLESVKFKIHTSKQSGTSKLAPVEGAHKIGYTDTADEREMLRNLLEQINEKEQFIDLKCPSQLRKGHKEDFAQFKKYYQALNDYLRGLKNTRKNVFSYSNGVITEKLLRYLSTCVPALRVIAIQIDHGKSFLISGDLKIQVVLTACLRMVAEREKKLPNTQVLNQENAMSENNPGSATKYIFNGDVGIVMTGDHNHVEINAKLQELLPILRDLQAGLQLNQSPESEEMQALDKVIEQVPKSPDSMKLIGDALNKVKKLINQGTQLDKLYNTAESIYKSLEILI